MSVAVDEKLFAKHLEKLEDLATCQICDGWFEDPVFALCGHSYCRQCINDVIAAKPKGQRTFMECMKCKAAIRKTSLRPAIVVAAMVQSIKSLCNNFDEAADSMNSESGSSGSGDRTVSSDGSSESNASQSDDDKLDPKAPPTALEAVRKSIKRHNEESIESVAGANVASMPSVKRFKRIRSQISSSSSGEEGEIKDDHGEKKIVEAPQEFYDDHKTRMPQVSSRIELTARELQQSTSTPKPGNMSVNTPTLEFVSSPIFGNQQRSKSLDIASYSTQPSPRGV